MFVFKELIYKNCCLRQTDPCEGEQLFSRIGRTDCRQPVAALDAATERRIAMSCPVS